MPNGDEETALGNPTEAPPATSSFPRPVPPPTAFAGRRGVSVETVGGSDGVVNLSANRMAFVELASLVLIFSAVSLRPYWSALVLYALSVGIVSLFFCLSLRLADHLRPGSLDVAIVRSIDPRRGRRATRLDVVMSFLFFWWVFGAFFITFRGPFTVTSNGYFAAWGGLAATVMWIGPTQGSLAEDGSRTMQQLGDRAKALFGLLTSSVVVLLASIRYVSVPQGAWGLSCGAVSAVAASVLMTVDREKIDPILCRVISAILLLMWLCGAGVLTFDGPFTFTGNGYFGSWFGLLCSLWYAAHDWSR